MTRRLAVSYFSSNNRKNDSFGKPLLMKSKQYLYNIFHIHSSQFLILMAQKSEEIMPDPDAIIRLRRDRLLGANFTGCDVKFCWMILIRKFEESFIPRPCEKTKRCEKFWFGYDVTSVRPTARPTTRTYANPSKPT